MGKTLKTPINEDFPGLELSEFYRAYLRFLYAQKKKHFRFSFFCPFFRNFAHDLKRRTITNIYIKCTISISLYHHSSCLAWQP